MAKFHLTLKGSKVPKPEKTASGSIIPKDKVEVSGKTDVSSEVPGYIRNISETSGVPTEKLMELREDRIGKLEEKNAYLKEHGGSIREAVVGDEGVTRSNLDDVKARAKAVIDAELDDVVPSLTGEQPRDLVGNEPSDVSIVIKTHPYILDRFFSSSPRNRRFAKFLFGLDPSRLISSQLEGNPTVLSKLQKAWSALQAYSSAKEHSYFGRTSSRGGVRDYVEDRNHMRASHRAQDELEGIANRQLAKIRAAEDSDSALNSREIAVDLGKFFGITGDENIDNIKTFRMKGLRDLFGADESGNLLDASLTDSVLSYLGVSPNDSRAKAMLQGVLDRYRPVSESAATRMVANYNPNSAKFTTPEEASRILAAALEDDLDYPELETQIGNNAFNDVYFAMQHHLSNLLKENIDDKTVPADYTLMKNLLRLLLLRDLESNRDKILENATFANSLGADSQELDDVTGMLPQSGARHNDDFKQPNAIPGKRVDEFYVRKTGSSSSDGKKKTFSPTSNNSALENPVALEESLDDSGTAALRDRAAEGVSASRDFDEASGAEFSDKSAADTLADLDIPSDFLTSDELEYLDLYQQFGNGGFSIENNNPGTVKFSSAARVQALPSEYSELMSELFALGKKLPSSKAEAFQNLVLDINRRFNSNDADPAIAKVFADLFENPEYKLPPLTKSASKKGAKGNMPLNRPAKELTDLYFRALNRKPQHVSVDDLFKFLGFPLNLVGRVNPTVTGDIPADFYKSYVQTLSKGAKPSPDDAFRFFIDSLFYSNDPNKPFAFDVNNVRDVAEDVIKQVFLSQFKRKNAGILSERDNTNADNLGNFLPYGFDFFIPQTVTDFLAKRLLNLRKISPRKNSSTADPRFYQSILDSLSEIGQYLSSPNKDSFVGQLLSGIVDYTGNRRITFDKTELLRRLWPVAHYAGRNTRTLGPIRAVRNFLKSRGVDLSKFVFDIGEGIDAENAAYDTLGGMLSGDDLLKLINTQLPVGRVLEMPFASDTSGSRKGLLGRASDKATYSFWPFRDLHARSEGSLYVPGLSHQPNSPTHSMSVLRDLLGKMAPLFGRDTTSDRSYRRLKGLTGADVWSDYFHRDEDVQTSLEKAPATFPFAFTEDQLAARPDFGAVEYVYDRDAGKVIPRRDVPEDAIAESLARAADGDETYKYDILSPEDMRVAWIWQKIAENPESLDVPIRALFSALFGPDEFNAYMSNARSKIRDRLLEDPADATLSVEDLLDAFRLFDVSDSDTNGVNLGNSALSQILSLYLNGGSSDSIKRLIEADPHLASIRNFYAKAYSGDLFDNNGSSYLSPDARFAIDKLIADFATDITSWINGNEYAQAKGLGVSTDPRYLSRSPLPYIEKSPGLSNLSLLFHALKGFLSSIDTYRLNKAKQSVYDEAADLYFNSEQ